MKTKKTIATIAIPTAVVCTLIALNICAADSAGNSPWRGVATIAGCIGIVAAICWAIAILADEGIL